MEGDVEMVAGGRENGGLPRTDFQRSVYCLLGLPFDAVTMREAVGLIGAAAASRSRCFLSTPNLNFLIASQRDPEFRDSVIRSDLSVADGMPLVWLARLLGVPIRERVAGSDLFESFMQGTGRVLKVFFFGGPDGVAEAAWRRLNAISSPVRCVGFESPGSGTVEQMSGRETLERINRSGADFVVVALGARKGQAWIERNRTALHAPVISHLGAVINFVAGTVSRAPVWMRMLGFEWLWRIKEEPALWRRYLYDGAALARLILTRVLPALVYRGLDVVSARAPANAAVGWVNGSICLTLSGSWLDEDLPALRNTFERITREQSDIALDLTGAARVDAGFIGTLMLLYGHQSRLGRLLRIVSVSPSARRAFGRCCAEFLLYGQGNGRACELSQRRKSSRNLCQVTRTCNRVFWW